MRTLSGDIEGVREQAGGRDPGPHRGGLPLQAYRCADDGARRQQDRRPHAGRRLQDGCRCHARQYAAALRFARHRAHQGMHSICLPAMLSYQRTYMLLLDLNTVICDAPHQGLVFAEP